MNIRLGSRVTVVDGANAGQLAWQGRSGTVIGTSMSFFHVVLDGFDYLSEDFAEPWHLFYPEELTA